MNSKKVILGMLIILWVAFNSYAATTTFTGAVNNSWHIPYNWDTGSVPTASDDVVIEGSHTVIILSAAVAKNIDLYDNALLRLLPSGSLDINVGDIVMKDNASIRNQGAMQFMNTSDAIKLLHNAQFFNDGQINITDDGSDPILMYDDSHFENDGMITLDGAGNESIDLSERATFINRGFITITNADDEGIELDDGYFYNYNSISISECNEDGIDIDDSDSVFENYGTINISDTDDSGLEVDDGIFDNKEGAIVTINNSDDESVYIESGGELLNTGIISMTNGDDDGVYLSSSSSLLNNENTINIDCDFSSDNAIDNNGEINNACTGVINILTNNSIDNDGKFSNDGVLATNYTGTNTNEGDLTNNNIIIGTAGFTASPNAVVGTGSISVGSAPQLALSSSQCIDEGAFGCTGTTNINYATQTWTQTADACVPSFPYQSDNISYAFQQLCGDGSITAKVESVTPIGWGGISFRETVDDNSKMVQLMANGSTLLRRQIRNSTGSWAMPTQFPALNQKWLRIEREGNHFRGYRSPNGINWFFVFETEVSMNDCVSVGVVSHNYNVNIAATAVFTNVSVDQVVPLEDIELPLAEQTTNANTADGTLSANIYPNPTTGWVNVELEAIDEVVDLRIFNTLGQMVDAIRMDPSYGLNQTVNLEGMPTGTYFFHLIGEKGSKSVEQVMLK